MIKRLFEDLGIIFKDLGMNEVFLHIENNTIYVDELRVKQEGDELIILSPMINPEGEEIEYFEDRFLVSQPRTLMSHLVTIVSNRRISNYLMNSYPMGFDLGLKVGEVDDLPF